MLHLMKSYDESAGSFGVSMNYKENHDQRTNQEVRTTESNRVMQGPSVQTWAEQTSQSLIPALHGHMQAGS